MVVLDGTHFRRSNLRRKFLRLDLCLLLKEGHSRDLRFWGLCNVRVFVLRGKGTLTELHFRVGAENVTCAKV